MSRGYESVTGTARQGISGRAFRGLALALALALASVAAGCGKGTEAVESPERQTLELVVEPGPGPERIGLVTGLETGAFEQAGLDLQVANAGGAAPAIREVAAGRADLAIAPQPEVVLAREEGLDVVAVGAIVDRAGSAMMWLPRSGIRQLSDLRGRTVAMPDTPYHEAFLDAILAGAGLAPQAIRRIHPSDGLARALVDGTADAILASSPPLQEAELRRRGGNPTVLDIHELGIPPYDRAVLVASSASLEERGEELRLFMAALERGTRAAGADTRAAAADLAAANPELSPGLARDAVNAVLPMESGGDRPFGWMSREQWQELIAWMRDRGLIASLPDAAEMMTNRYLPTGPPED